MDAESITLVLNAWILAFRKLFEDIGLDRVIRRRLRKALVFKYDSLNQNVFSMRTHSSSVKIAKKNAPYGAPQRAVCGFEAVFRLTHTVNQAVIHHDQYSTAGEQATPLRCMAMATPRSSYVTRPAWSIRLPAGSRMQRASILPSCLARSINHFSLVKTTSSQS